MQVCFMKRVRLIAGYTFLFKKGRGTGDGGRVSRDGNPEFACFGITKQFFHKTA